MKMSLGRLRALIVEAALHEAWVVNYTEKNGTPGKPRLFGGPNAERLAMQYASTVKNGEAMPVSDEAPDVNVHDVNASGYGEPGPAAPGPRTGSGSGTPTPRNWKPKGTYKVYGGSKKHHPGRSVVTRLKGQVYGPRAGETSAFMPGEMGDVSFDKDKLLIKKQNADHVQTWEPFDQA